MQDYNTSSVFISAEQRYQYRITYPYTLSIDERIVNPGWPSRNLHWHDHFEIELILNGKGTHFFNGTQVPIQRGSAYLLTPMDLHALISDDDSPLHLLHIHFDDKAITDDVRNILLRYKYSCPLNLNDESFDHLITQFSELLYMLSSKNNLREASAKLMLSVLCTTMMKHSELGADRLLEHEVRNPAVHQVMLYILYNFRKKITMKQLGDIASLSPNHLSLLFKNNYGISCTQLIMKLRMQYATKLLKNASLSIEKIAEESGFSSTSYFIRMFREKYGMTPREFCTQTPAENNPAQNEFFIL